MPHSSYEATKMPGYFRQQLLAAIALSLIVFLACLVGIMTRFDSGFSSLWGANALMLGLLLRLPHADTLLSWCLGILAFIAADLLTGASPFKAVTLTCLNFIGIVTIYHIYRALPNNTIRLREPLAVLQMALACGVGALVCSIAGGLVTPLFFAKENFIHATSFWLVTEFVNYIAILPMILAAPKWTDAAEFWHNSKALSELKRTPLPLASLILSGIATVSITGPGAIAYPVPALLWCATRYSVFTTSILTFLSCVWLLVLLAQANHFEESELISLRLGVALITLGPIMLASVIGSHNRLLANLRKIAEHDDLTGTHTRSAFLTAAQVILSQNNGPIGVLMIDLDHFKQVNDKYGHAAGDQVLITVTARIRNCLRSKDVLGRLGGEEFAVIIQNAAVDEIPRITERIRETIASSTISLQAERSLSVTTSIGLAIHQQGDLSIEQLLAQADEALYQAKAGGRNRVVIAQVDPLIHPA